VIADIADRLTSAWDSIRTQTRGMQPAEAEPLIGEILKACSALPSQWLPRLTERDPPGGRRVTRRATKHWHSPGAT
jgi:hypothetical protein